MTRARQQLISLDDTPYYHCIARCVRRSFLCGTDSYSGKNFNHRRQWLVDQFKFQTKIFCVEVSAYAVMNNHYHLVLFVDSKKALNLTDKEVAERWIQLFHGPLLIKKFIGDQELNEFELLTVSDIIAVWRKRLMDISWFMRYLNEFIARKANAEDDCKGRFWEGRFKSQALLDDHALLSCMIYVDLNPARAGIAEDLEHSDFTSIQERIRVYKAANRSPKSNSRIQQPSHLSSFAGGSKSNETAGSIHFTLEDYIDLTDWTGRCVRADKRGSIRPQAPTSLSKLNLDEATWLHFCNRVQRSHPVAVGDNSSLQEYNAHHHKCWTIIARHKRPGS